MVLFYIRSRWWKCILQSILQPIPSILWDSEGRVGSLCVPPCRVTGVEPHSLWARPRCFNWLVELALKSSLSDAISSSALLLLKDRPSCDSQAAWPDRDLSPPLPFSEPSLSLLFPRALISAHFTLDSYYFGDGYSAQNYAFFPLRGLVWAGWNERKRENWTLYEYFAFAYSGLWNVWICSDTFANCVWDLGCLPQKWLPSPRKHASSVWVMLA